MSIKASRKSMVAVAAVVLAAGAGATAVWAQQLNPGISCLEGSVSALDYSEFASKYRESIWDNKAAVRLVAESSELELTITDLTGQQVCEETAELKTKCKFSFSSSYSGTFNIRIDNKLDVANSAYRLCAE